MFAYTQKEKEARPGTAHRSSSAGRTPAKYTWQESSAFRLQSGSNQSPQPAVQVTSSVEAGIHDHHGSVLPRFAMPCVRIIDKDPQGGTKNQPADVKKPPAAKTPAVTKRAGVESLWVNWTENIKSPTAPKLRLDFQAKFKSDAKHDPALAEFRQFVYHTIEVVAGPHKSPKVSTAPLHNDNYSRADDKGNHDITDVYFLGNDNPGPNDLDKDDDIKYSFTAEQRIIDTSDSNKIIAKVGPHTAGIIGKHPRKAWGVPKKIDW